MNVEKEVKSKLKDWLGQAEELKHSRPCEPRFHFQKYLWSQWAQDASENPIQLSAFESQDWIWKAKESCKKEDVEGGLNFLLCNVRQPYICIGYIWLHNLLGTYKKK